MLKFDTNLVAMQSRLSGAGEKEHLFWKNYFINCAVSVLYELNIFRWNIITRTLQALILILHDKLFPSLKFTRFDLGLAVEEIWGKRIDGESAVNQLQNKTLEEKDKVGDEPSSLTVKQSTDPVTISVVNNPLSISETSDSSSSFVKDGFDDKDLDSLEAEIAKELNDE
jgi:hypothetical protein